MKRLCLSLLVLVLFLTQTPTTQATAYHMPDGTQTNHDSINTSLLLFDIGSFKNLQDYFYSFMALSWTTDYTEGIANAEPTIDKETDESPDPSSTSYLLDTSKTYTWTSYVDGQTTLSTITYSDEIYEEQPEWDQWKETIDGETAYFLVKETEEGLYTGYPYSEYYSDLRYPLFEGKTWDTSDEEIDFNTYTVTAMDLDVTVKAGTFHDVVQVDASHGWTFFYAPDIGLIKTEQNGTVMNELSELQD